MVGLEAQIDLSKIRLERLSSFKGVDVETPVAKEDDQIDVDFSLEEQPSGSISATLGYSQGYGLIWSQLQSEFMMGSGNSWDWAVFRNIKNRLALTIHPYYTLDNISRGLMCYSTVDYKQANLARFETDSGGLDYEFLDFNR